MNRNACYTSGPEFDRACWNVIMGVHLSAPLHPALPKFKGDVKFVSERPLCFREHLAVRRALRAAGIGYAFKAGAVGYYERDVGPSVITCVPDRR